MSTTRESPRRAARWNATPEPGALGNQPYENRKPRARPDAGVSTPLHWDELDAKADLRARFNVRNVAARLKEKDPWAAYWTTRQSITAKMKKALGISSRSEMGTDPISRNRDRPHFKDS